MEPAIIIPIAAAVIVAVVVIALYFEKKRAEAIRAAAEAMGFSYAKKGGASLLNALMPFTLFKQGHSRKIHHVLHGKANDIDVTVMDYRYTTGGGKNSSTHQQTVLLFRSDLLQLPSFVLRPEHVFDKIGGALGFQDIDFDAYPEFSRRYVLKGKDEEAIRALFHKDILTFYEQQRGISTEGLGKTLLYYRASRRVKPAELQAFIADGLTVFGLFRSAK